MSHYAWILVLWDLVLVSVLLGKPKKKTKQMKIEPEGYKMNFYLNKKSSQTHTYIKVD